MKKSDTLAKTLTDLQKIYGEKAVITANDAITDFGSFTTGSLLTDKKLNGGYPIGRITEVYGPESSGKTTSALHAIADAQAKDTERKAMFIDLEGTFDKIYAANLGVNLEELILIPPTNGEEAISICEKICKTGQISIVVLDSVATMLPIKQEEGDVGNANMAYHAKLVGEFVKRMVPIMNRYKICFIFLNQLREKPGVTYGNPEYPTGGNSLKFYASVRLDIRKSGSLNKNKDGVITSEPRKIKIIKNKINDTVHQFTMVDIVYGEGIDQTGEIVDAAVEIGLIEKSGSWYSYEGAKIGQGREAAKDFLNDNEELLELLKTKVLEY